MKKIITCLLVFTLFTLNAKDNKADSLAKIAVETITKGSQTAYNDAKTFYKEDVRKGINYTVDKIEQSVDTLYKILGKGYNQLSKGAAHTFEVLKTQQLVKSLHHLFYWILGIVIIVILSNKIKAVVKNNKVNDWDFASIIALIILDILLMYMNINNFMEMWTGFINPEYGVYMEILQYLNK